MKSTTKVRVVKCVSEAEVMARYRLLKRAVMSCDGRNALIVRNYRKLQRDIGRSPYARSLGDEAESVINELLTTTARTFDPARYRNPSTGGRFTAADIGDPELDRVFRNYC